MSAPWGVLVWHGLVPVRHPVPDAQAARVWAARLVADGYRAEVRAPGVNDASTGPVVRHSGVNFPA